MSKEVDGRTGVSSSSAIGVVTPIQLHLSLQGDEVETVYR
jgi:hypothetical protein